MINIVHLEEFPSIYQDGYFFIVGYVLETKDRIRFRILNMN